MIDLSKIQTTELGIERIRRNLNLSCSDVVAWCKEHIEQSKKIERKGKNFYVHIDNAILTVNAYTCTIITAHKKA